MAARWVLIGRLLGMTAHEVAGPFSTIVVPAATAMLVGSALLPAVSGRGWPLVALAFTCGVTLITNLALLRLLAPGIMRNVVDVLPLPVTIADRVRWSLRLDRSTTS
jgi:hypothetical protein